MKRVTAYQLATGDVYISLDAAKREAHRRYDEGKTLMHKQLVVALDSHVHATKALEWIDQNFLLISGANDLKRDLIHIEQEDQS